jgi:hypothetical protein
MWVVLRILLKDDTSYHPLKMVLGDFIRFSYFLQHGFTHNPIHHGTLSWSTYPGYHRVESEGVNTSASHWIIQPYLLSKLFGGDAQFIAASWGIPK